MGGAGDIQKRTGLPGGVLLGLDLVQLAGASMWVSRTGFWLRVRTRTSKAAWIRERRRVVAVELPGLGEALLGARGEGLQVLALSSG